MKDEKTIIIDINLTRGLVALLTLALLVAALLGYLAWGQDEVAASGPQAPLASSAGMRQYYLTTSSYQGDEALTACDSGYHMASLWEITDPSNLKYDTTRGRTQTDSGQGPPSFSASGWVRTGYRSYSSTIPGHANCYAWTSYDGSHRGTYASLLDDWTLGSEDIHVWEVGIGFCNGYNLVWCVED